MKLLLLLWLLAMPSVFAGGIASEGEESSVSSAEEGEEGSSSITSSEEGEEEASSGYRGAGKYPSSSGSSPFKSYTPVTSTNFPGYPYYTGYGLIPLLYLDGNQPTTNQVPTPQQGISCIQSFLLNNTFQPVNVTQYLLNITYDTADVPDPCGRIAGVQAVLKNETLSPANDSALLLNTTEYFLSLSACSLGVVHEPTVVVLVALLLVAWV